MKKLLSLSLFLFFVGVVAFTQTAPSKILDTSDIEVFIENYESIDASMTILDDYLDDYYSEFDGPKEMIEQIRSKKTPPEIQDIMIANGLGPDGFEKMIIIILSVGAFYMEDLFFSQGLEMNDNFNSEYGLELQSIKEEINSLKSSVHTDDLKLIKMHYKNLINAMDFTKITM